MRPRAKNALTALVLVALIIGAYRARKNYIRNFFVPGEGGAAVPTLPMPATTVADGQSLGLPAAARVRVILLDGVDAMTAAGLPQYSRACERGLDLRVDVGFPTVSLPIQRVLWTGLTQQQTGILFFNKLIDPPAIGVPAQVPGSVAVAESHAQIIHSLGFHELHPAAPRATPDDWSRKTDWRPWFDIEAPTGFEKRAREVVLADARLAFVHVLRTDSIAHKRGRVSEEFTGAAQWADSFAGRLIDAELEQHGPGTRWFLLADHGHRAGGGHGGAEPGIRTVRACIFGGLDSERAAAHLDVHLIDISRALADSLGVTLDPNSSGRPLYAAMNAEPSPNATLPTAPTERWIMLLLLLAAAALLTGWAARGSWIALPWWWPVAYLSVTIVELVPSMSTHMIYKADGHIIGMAALTGIAVLAVTSTLALRRLSGPRAAIAQLALPLAAAVGGLIMTGGTGHLLGMAGEPPLLPWWTGHTSLFGVLFFTGSAVVALALLATGGPLATDQTTASETPEPAA